MRCYYEMQFDLFRMIYRKLLIIKAIVFGYVPVNGGIGLIKDITNRLRCQL